MKQQIGIYAIALTLNFSFAQSTPPDIKVLPPKTIFEAASSSSSVSTSSSAASSKEVAIPTITPTVSVGSESSSSSSEFITIEGTTEEIPELPKGKIAELNKQIKLLEQMVNIGSDTQLEIEGVNKVQDIIAKELKTLKFNVELIDNPDPFHKSGKLLVATYPGNNTQQFITVLAHADTVFPAMTGFVKFERLSDVEALGPGVVDNKGGVVVALEAFKKYLSVQPKPEYSLRFVVSPSEEIGSTGFLSLFENYSLSSIAVFGMEPALDKGDIIDSRRGDRWYEVKIKGREAHAGRAHDQGINACHELAIKIRLLQKLTNYKREVTINVGAIKGGKDKYAIVCGEASMKLDVRFSDMKNRERIIKSVEDVLKTQYVKAQSDGAKAITEWKIVDDPKPFSSDPKSKNLTEIYKKVIFDLEGQLISAKRSGGTSDINFFYRPGVVLIDGLGPIGSGMHTHEEKIQLRSLQTRAEALSKLIQAASL